MWNTGETNAEQQYLTHGIFRYFGKLPPTITGKILDELGVRQGTTVIDLMCGSGTTLLEAAVRGASAIGVDANDLSALISRVKTRPMPATVLDKLVADFLQTFERQLQWDWKAVKPQSADPYSMSGVPPIRNIAHWFLPATIEHLLALREWAERPRTLAEKEVALLAFLAAVRASSNASVRTGRLFFDRDKAPQNPYRITFSKLEKITAAVKSLAGNTASQLAAVEVRVADARSTGLKDEIAEFSFCHPPYFSLYRYSSDVLRFELEWGKFPRKEIASREMEDGFKTTDAKLAGIYVSDLLSIMREAHRLTRPGGQLAVVTADTTLSGKHVGIMDMLLDAVDDTGWSLRSRIRRIVKFAQASYHRSARADLKRADDEILVFVKE